MIKNFVKALDKTKPGFQCLCERFATLVAHLTAHRFKNFSEMFDHLLHDKEKKAWEAINPWQSSFSRTARQMTTKNTWKIC